jgi:hypothetical protein
MSTPSLLNIPYLYKAGTLYSQIPESGAGDFTVTRTTTVANRSTRINKDGFIETVLDNVPRLDYPVGGAVNGCPALLVEPAATNGIRNNSMVGAVVGSPGTIPTNWIVGGVGLTQQIVAVGTENGVSYIDLRLSGTATASTATLSFESATQIAALTGQTWTISSYLKTISLPSPPSSFSFAITERTSGGAIVVQQTTNVSLTSNLARYTYSPTLNGGATTAFAQPRLFFVLVVGQTYDFTVRVGYPQMELGSVATSVIPTTTAAVTRSAEVISRTSASALIGQSEGTIYAEVDLRNSAVTAIFAIDDGDTSDFISIIRLANFTIRAQIRRSGAPIASIITSSPVALGTHKIALAYKNADYALYIDGVSAGTSANSTDYPATALTQCVLSNASYGPLNDRIRDIELHPNRLTNAQLATLTAL